MHIQRMDILRHFDGVQMRHNISGRHADRHTVYAYQTGIGNEAQIRIGRFDLHRMGGIDGCAVYVLAGRDHDDLGVATKKCNILNKQ